MNKFFSKKVFGLSMSLAMLANIIALPVLAVETSSAVKKRPADNFCSRLDQIAVKSDLSMADKSKKSDDQTGLKEANLEKSRSDRDERLAQQRTDADKNTANRYLRMQGKAKNDAQKTAIATFQTAMTTAVNARKLAFDSARVTFRAGVDTAVAARKTEMQSAVTIFQTSVKDAEAKAKADCAAGVDPATARATFQAAIKAAREKFSLDRKAVVKLTSNLKTLTAARKTALEKARIEFKTAVEKATKDLKTALAAAKTVKLKPITDAKIKEQRKFEKPVKIEDPRVVRKFTVKISGSSFSPSSLSVAKGDTVTWVNEDSLPHTVTAVDGSFNSGNMAQGASFTHTFDSFGSVTYGCAYHSSMQGSVIVRE